MTQEFLVRVESSDPVEAMIDHEFVERLVREKRGYPVVAQHINHRFWGEREDVLQEALLTTWKNRNRLQDPAVARAFFHGIVKRVALNYRPKRIDRANYCEIEEWHAWDDGAESTVERREREIREAQEQLNALLLQVRLKHRITFWEWRKRGYRCETHAQQMDLQRLIEALRRAANQQFEPRERGVRFSYRSGEEC